MPAMMKLLKKLGFFSAFILPALWVFGYYLGGIWTYATVIFAFFLIPILDYFVGTDTQNAEKETETNLSNELYYRFVTYVWAFMQVGLVVWACFVVADQKMNNLEWFGFLLSAMTVTGGVGITVAHELGHRNNRLEQFYAKLILMTVSYMQFFVEHNRGHHVWVATPHDPATSLKNQTFYRFWVQSVFGGFKSAWELEKNRLQKKKINIWSSQNDMIWAIVLPILFCTVLTLATSILRGEMVWQVPVFFFLQGILGFSLLEAVNYIEHYGILRKQTTNGKYERVEHLHSWNASQLVSNFFLFQLQRHSDHHANASRRYQVLRHFDESPQLPSGYPTMILMALVPPLWFKIMNKRLESWQQQYAQ
jgi:alkane 1-monooxygenase